MLPLPCSPCLTAWAHISTSVLRRQRTSLLVCRIPLARIHSALTKLISATHLEIECKTANFWHALRDFPMHLKAVPRNIDIDFLGALSFGASGEQSLGDLRHTLSISTRTERILEWNYTAFPFTDDQTRRLVQIYRDLRCTSIACLRTSSQELTLPLFGR